jgi:hypothetical protein
MITLSLLLRRGFNFHVAAHIVLVTGLGSHTLFAQQPTTGNSAPSVHFSPAPSNNSLSPINIQYTGRLFGYYRIEPNIALSEPMNAYDEVAEAGKNGLPVPAKHDLITRPGAFLRHKQQTSPDLLLGMGDNFGPEFGASIQQVPLSRTVHAGGLYWTAHVQKVVNRAKTYSFSFDTAGDGYLLPGYTLPTQTRYAITNKLAFNINFFGNLSLSPTYSVFNFGNQGAAAQRISVNTTSFETMLKWYYGRDTQSPPLRLLWFGGPKSEDQTTSSKLK